MPRKIRGFSLFELVVFIISVAIIYAYAANRFSSFPAEAERANFLAITAQLQSAISLELMTGYASGRTNSGENIVGANPMDFLLSTPSNYLGAFNSASSAELSSRSWYFDVGTRQLVYRISNNDGVYLLIDGVRIETAEIRFTLSAEYTQVDSNTGLPVSVLESAGNSASVGNVRSRFSGILMRPVVPYLWESRGLDTSTLNG